MIIVGIIIISIKHKGVFGLYVFLLKKIRWIKSLIINLFILKNWGKVIIKSSIKNDKKNHIT